MLKTTALGAVLISFGMVIIGITDNFVRLISDAAGLWQFHLLRSAMALPMIVLGALALGLSLRARDPRAVLLRSAVQTVAIMLYFGALPMLPIAQVGAALFTAPIWVLLFSAALYGRRIGMRHGLAVALGFLGVLVMLRPDLDALSPVALMPLAAGALYGFSNLLTRERCAGEPVALLVAGFFGGLAVASVLALGLLALFPTNDAWRAAAPFLTAGWQPVSATLLFWIFVQAAGSLVGVGLIARGYQSGETADLAVFEYSFLISASACAWILWGEALRPVDFIGIAMILASGAVIAGAGRGRDPAAA